MYGGIHSKFCLGIERDYVLMHTGFFTALPFSLNVALCIPPPFLHLINSVLYSCRPSGSPPRLGTKSNILSPSSDVLIRPRSLPSSHSIVSPAVRNIGHLVSKRTRSPPSIYCDEFLQENSSPTEDGIER